MQVYQQEQMDSVLKCTVHQANWEINSTRGARKIEKLRSTEKWKIDAREKLSNCGNWKIGKLNSRGRARKLKIWKLSNWRFEQNVIARETNLELGN